MRQFSLTEAKARLSELLDIVERGEEVLILRHGKPVARMARERERSAEVEARRQAALKGLRHFPRAALEPGETIRDLIDEGRK